MSKSKKAPADRIIGTFQGVDVYADADGMTYMDLDGFGDFYLGVEGDAAEELATLKAALAKAKRRTRAEVDAEIVRVLRDNCARCDVDNDCLAHADPDAAALRSLCAEETAD